MKGGGTAGGGKKGSGIAYAKPSDPPFLARMKQSLGMGESTEPKLEDKLPTSGGPDDLEKDDERPTVVVLKEGDLTQDEAEKVWKEEDSKSDDGKVVFKRKADSGEEKEKKSTKKKKMESRAIKDQKLLSFDEEEHDDG